LGKGRKVLMALLRFIRPLVSTALGDYSRPCVMHFKANGLPVNQLIPSSFSFLLRKYQFRNYATQQEEENKLVKRSQKYRTPKRHERPKRRVIDAPFVTQTPEEKRATEIFQRELQEGIPSRDPPKQQRYGPLRLPPIPTNTSIIPFHPIPLETATSLDGFAIVLVGGKQFKVVKGDLIVSEKLLGVDIGDEIVLDKVLMIGSRDFTAIGKPILTKAKVLAQIQENTKSEKILVFKKRRRKNSRRLRGHRQNITVLLIQDVLFDYKLPTPS